MTTVSSGAAKGCPAPTTNVVGYITGPGAWADGILGVGNTDLGVSLTSDFGVELADTFSGIAQSNGLTIAAGKYTITVYCADLFGVDRYGEFSAPVWFTDATRYQTTDPAAPATVTTTTALSAAPASAEAGAPVTLTASVTPSTAIGTVQFTDTVGGTTTNIGSPVAVTDGTATVSTTTLVAGSHSLTAIFIPTNAAAFTSSTSAARAVTVTSPPAQAVQTSTTLSATPAAGSTAGEVVSLIAAVAPATATGTVQFTDSIAGTPVAIGAAVSVTGGTATTTTTALAAGTHSLRAVFTPADAGAFTSSTSNPLAYQVTAPAVPPTSTSTALSVTPAGTASAGSTVTLAATVSPSEAAGTVQFTDTAAGSTTNLGSPVSVSQGQAVLSTTSIAAGEHSFRAVFTPADAAAYAASSSAPASYSVTSPAGPVATTVTLAAAPPGTSAAGTAVTFTATVSPQSAAGTVSFTESGSSTLIGGASVTVSGGTASVTTSALTVGTHQITAAFFPADAAAFRSSTSQPIDYVTTASPAQPVSTATVLEAAPGTSAAIGTDVALTATVTPPEANGTVQFIDAAAGTTASLAPPVQLQGGKALVTVRFSTAGPRVLRAVFTPASLASYSSSASADLAYTVTPATNPQAKPTRIWLTSWQTRWWCPRPAYQAVQPGVEPSKHRDRRRCNSAVLVARVSPRLAAGSVQFTNTTGDGPAKVLGGPVTVVDGWAVLVAEVPVGRYTFAATFTPADPSAFQPSTSNENRFRCRKS